MCTSRVSSLDMCWLDSYLFMKMVSYAFLFNAGKIYWFKYTVINAVSSYNNSNSLFNECVCHAGTCLIYVSETTISFNLWLYIRGFWNLSLQLNQYCIKPNYNILWHISSWKLFRHLHASCNLWFYQQKKKN